MHVVPERVQRVKPKSAASYGLPPCHAPSRIVTSIANTPVAQKHTRFRVVDANGNDIRYNQSVVNSPADGSYQYPKARSQDIRVSCAEPAAGIYSYNPTSINRRFAGFKRAAFLTMAETQGEFRELSQLH